MKKGILCTPDANRVAETIDPICKIGIIKEEIFSFAHGSGRDEMVLYSKTSTAIAMGLCLLGFSAGAAEADSPSATSTDAAAEAASPTEIRRLVGRLDADRYADRQAAQRRLGEIGLPAVGPLAAVAPRGSLELEQRAMQILEKFYRSPDEKLCDSAQAALEKLADNSRESIAKRAKEILEFPPYGLKPGNWLGEGLVHGLGGVRPIRLGGGGGIVIGGGEVRLGEGAQIVVSGVDDEMRFVDIIQGSGLGVLILENEKSGTIEIHTCQQQPEGRAKYARFLAENKDQLRRAHPKIYAFYERFKGYRGGMVMNGAVSIQ